MDIRSMIEKKKNALIRYVLENGTKRASLVSCNIRNVVTNVDISEDDINFLTNQYPDEIYIRGDIVEVKNIFRPRNVSEISVQEKIDGFNKLYTLALENFDQIINGEKNGDMKHWCYEAVMNLLGPGVWDVINNASNGGK